MSEAPNTPWRISVLEKLRGYAGKDSMVEFGDYCEEMKDRIRPTTYHTGIIPTLDSLSAGFQQGEVIVLGGAQNEGKTLLTLSLIAAFAEQELVSAFFSFEQTPEQIAEKYKYAPPRFYMPRTLEAHTVYDPFIEKLKKRGESFLGELPTSRLQWIYLKLMEMVANGRTPQIVFIDFLHSLLGFGGDRVVWSIGGVMDALKKIALDLKVVIFVICHLNRDVKDGGEPSVYDLRESGWIENLADVVLLLWRQMDKRTGEPGVLSVLKIGKHRRKGNAKNRKIELVMTDRGLLVEHADREDFNAAYSY